MALVAGWLGSWGGPAARRGQDGGCYPARDGGCWPACSAPEQTRNWGRGLFGAPVAKVRGVYAPFAAGTAPFSSTINS